MRISVTLTIDMPHPEEWTNAFGTEGTATIRDDVKDYVANLVQQAAVWGEVDAEVYLK